MPALPLHVTEDYTVAGDTITFLVAPATGKMTIANYSYEPVGGTTDISGHVHKNEQKSDWNFSDTTWQLTETPELNDQMIVFQEDQGGNFLWTHYVNQPSTSHSIRLMELSPDGTFLQWSCPEIQGFDDVAGEVGTARCAHPTNPKIFYVATKANDTHIRIYRSDDWATVTKVADLTPTAGKVRQCIRMYVEQTTNYVWFIVGAHAPDSTPPFPGTYDSAVDGLWGAADGITFTQRGTVPALVATPPNVTGLWVTETPRTIMIWHDAGVDWNGLDPDFFNMGFAVSTDDGATWTKTVFGSEVSPAPYRPIPSRPEIQAFPVLTGATNIRLSIQENNTSFQRLRSYVSSDGGANFTLVGVVPAASVSPWIQTDGAYFMHDPLTSLRVGAMNVVTASETARTTDGGASFVSKNPVLGGDEFRQISTHWTLPWIAGGFHPTGPPGTGGSPTSPNHILISTDAGATTPWVELATAAGFALDDLLIHGVDFVKNNSRV